MSVSPPQSVPGDVRRRPIELLARIEQTAREMPQSSALRFIDDNGHTLTWTYRQLWRRSVAIANELGERSVRPGDRIALVFFPGLDFVPALLGCQLARAIPVPTCYPRMRRPMPRLNSVVADCQPTFLIGTQAVLDGISGEHVCSAASSLPRIAVDSIKAYVDDGGAGDPDTEDPTVALDNSRLDGISDDDVALLQYTSGSTSDPKGVRVLHRNLNANLAAIARGFRVRRVDSDTPPVGVFWLPFFHDMGLIGGILTPLFVGGTSILMSPQTFMRRPIEWLRAIATHRAAISGAPNFAYQLAFDRVAPTKVDGLDLSCWKTAFCGAEPINDRTLGDFARRFSACGFSEQSFYPCYGLAEATLLVAGGEGPGPLRAVTVERWSFDRGIVEFAGPKTPTGERHRKTLVSCGSAAQGTEIAIVDPGSRTLQAGNQIGEIWIRGDSVADGYWNREDDSFGQITSDGQTGWLRSGDRGFLSDGDLFVTGRIKDTMIIRGRNLSPQDIEQTVRSVPSLRAGMIAAFPVVGLRGEAVGLTIEVDRQVESESYPSMVRDVRRAVIDVHEVDPFHIVLVRIGSLPVTTSGKVRRGHCRESFESDTLKVVHRFDAPRMVSQTPIAMPDLANRCRLSDVDEIATEVAGWMGQWMVTRAGVDPGDLEPKKPLIAYGLDSMMATEMAGEIEAWAGVSVSPAAAWDYPSIAELSGYIASRVRGTQPPTTTVHCPSHGLPD